MRAISLFAVLVLAKTLVVLDRDTGAGPELTALAPIAYLGQDALLALCFAAVDRALCRPGLSPVAWSLYAAIVLYTALNVAVARVLSTPLTWPMLRAADGALADSIGSYLTARNLSGAVLVLVAAAAVPALARRVPTAARWSCLGLALVLAAAGPIAGSGLETRGLHRTALIALCTSAFPRVAAADAAADGDAAPDRAGALRWRDPSPRPGARDLRALRGVAAGRNVVLCVLESTGARYLRPYGAEMDPMPNLTRLAQRALLCENAYAVYPESIKGLVALQHAVHPAMDLTPEQHARIPLPSLGAVLRQRGYDTALFHSGRFAYLGMRAIVERGGYGTLADAGTIGGELDSSFGVDEQDTVAGMLAWLDERLGSEQPAPFFLAYLPIAGHHPYDSPEPGPFPADSPIGAYRNALHAADRALGDLVAGLDARGLWDDTLLVVVGDHGEAFGQHPGNFGHVFQLYEENVRVPLLFVAPERIAERLAIADVASHVDVAPTILDLLGLGAPAGIDGRSLLEPLQCDALMFTDYSLAILALRSGPWKLVHEVESGRSRLFDLAADPGELRDLAGVHPERAEAYRDRLLRWCAAQRARIARWSDVGR